MTKVSSLFYILSLYSIWISNINAVCPTGSLLVTGTLLVSSAYYTCGAMTEVTISSTLTSIGL